MKNDWISLLKRVEKLRAEDPLITLKLYSDESGSIDSDHTKIIEFMSKEDLTKRVEDWEHTIKYKAFYDILLTFNKEDFYSVDNQFEDIRRRAFRI